jgi:lysophospholipase L1-like esterase
MFIALFPSVSLAEASRASSALDAHPLPSFSLGSGDRVVLLGSTFIERDQAHGYLEAALTGRFHQVPIQFRNLGWSGDTVFGEARAGFGSLADGFAQLKSHVLALDPTVILLHYGANESFAGKAGLGSFLAGLDVLLKTLDETKARIVFLSPLRHEDLGLPLPNPAEHNQDLKMYSDAIAAVAAQRGEASVNLYALLGAKLPAARRPLTDNGIHLTGYGYWLAAPVIEQALGLPARRWQVEIDAKQRNILARGTTVSQARFSPEALSFEARDQLLPLSPPPADSPPAAAGTAGSRVLRVFDLPEGTYALKVAGQEVAVASAQQWAVGITITSGPDFAQAEKLRQAVVAKNLLYYYRWRPQNETYLFGFRKHEQGQNAVEIPQFDPLVAEREATIHALSAPVPRAYQIILVDPK